MTNKSIAYNKAYKFSVRIVPMYKHLSAEKREFILSKQLLRSGTSIGANIAEANGAISNADFSHKLSISYKECLETKYWLNLLKDTEYLDSKTFTEIISDADELAKILFSIIRTTRIEKKTKQ